jgi:nucleotide-binding universal stress UspA family protein
MSSGLLADLRPLGHNGPSLPREPPMKIDHIVCALDLSDAGPGVAQAAIELAEQHNAHLTFVHVLPGSGSGRGAAPMGGMLLGPRGGASGSFSVEAVMDVQRDEEEVRGRLREWVTRAEERTPGEVKLEVARGDPADVLIDYAQGGNCDLLVMGSRGSTGLLKALLGGVSYKVVRAAPCSVLTVRARPQHP